MSDQAEGDDERDPGGPGWTFLTKHALVLLAIQRDPEITSAGIAEAIGVSDRAVRNFLADLEVEGYLTRTRVGRRTRYAIHDARPLRHRMSRDQTVRKLLLLLEGDDDASGERSGERAGLRRELAALRRTRAREERRLAELRTRVARLAASLRRAADAAEEAAGRGTGPPTGGSGSGGR